MNRILQRTVAEGGGYCRPVLAILMIAFIVLAMIGAFALAQPDDCAEASGETNETNGGKCGWNLTWELDDDGNLTISGYGQMDMYYQTPGWGRGIKTITFNIDEGKTATIGFRAFFQSTSLVSVTGMSSISYIDSQSFMSCTSLTTIDSLDSVTKIDYQAFQNCSKLESITGWSSLNTIKYQAFSGCTSLTTISSLDSIQTIEKQVFQNCSKLESVTGLSSLTSIGDRAFDGCRSLKTIDSLVSVKSIGVY